MVQAVPTPSHLACHGRIWTDLPLEDPGPTTPTTQKPRRKRVSTLRRVVTTNKPEVLLLPPFLRGPNRHRAVSPQQPVSEGSGRGVPIKAPEIPDRTRIIVYGTFLSGQAKEWRSEREGVLAAAFLQDNWNASYLPRWPIDSPTVKRKQRSRRGHCLPMPGEHSDVCSAFE